MIRRGLMLLIVLSLSVPSRAASPMTDAELTALLENLERTRAMYLEAVAGMSDEQWTWKPAPERWSAAECTEHIVATELMLRSLYEPSMEEKASDEALAGDVRKDKAMAAMVVDRSQRFQAPEALQPKQKFATAAQGVAEFEGVRKGTTDLAKNGGDLRMFVAAHPLVGAMDVYSWIIFTSGHTERHTLQILEVKATEGYPK